MAREAADRMMVAQESVTELSLFQLNSLSEDLELAIFTVLEIVCNTFGFGLHHNSHLCISNLSKECTLNLRATDSIFSSPGDNKELSRAPSRMRTPILRDVDSLLVADGQCTALTEGMVDNSSRGGTFKMKGFFVDRDIR